MLRLCPATVRGISTAGVRAARGGGTAGARSRKAVSAAAAATTGERPDLVADESWSFSTAQRDEPGGGTVRLVSEGGETRRMTRDARTGDEQVTVTRRPSVVTVATTDASGRLTEQHYVYNVAAREWVPAALPAEAAAASLGELLAGSLRRIVSAAEPAPAIAAAAEPAAAAAPPSPPAAQAQSKPLA